APHRADSRHRRARRRPPCRRGAAARAPRETLARARMRPSVLELGGAGLLPVETPVVLLGGLDIVRALGFARVPAIIASLERRTPAMASRYCTGTVALPPGAGREAMVDALVRAGRWLAAQYGAPVPLFYDSDDRLALVQDHRDALARHFALLLNEPMLADALLDKARFQALAESRGLPVPRRLAWETLAEEPEPVLVKPKTRLGWEHSAVREMLFGGAGKARDIDCRIWAFDELHVHQIVLTITVEDIDT